MKQDLDIKVSPTLEHAALICETEERENSMRQRMISFIEFGWIESNSDDED